MKELKVSEAMPLAALIRMELASNTNVVLTKVTALGDDEGVKAFIINISLIDDVRITIEFGYKKGAISITITTDKKSIEWDSLSSEANGLKFGQYVDYDKIVITKESPVELAISRYSVERATFPTPVNKTLNGWRSMAKDIIGMALKQYNVNK